MAARKWSLLLLALTLITLTILGGITAFIDPFFHYHAPLSFLNYTLDNQRYQNNGILKHFDYNAIIIGDSMTENFKASECNALFDVSAVKTCFNGASLKELSDNLRNAIDVNPDIRMVVCGLNSWHLTEEQNFMRTDAEYPLYLYDSNPFNDVQYLLNKEVLIMHSIDIVGNTLHGIPSTTFDDYSSWSATTGKDAILAVSPGYPNPMRFGSLIQKQPTGSPRI